MSKDFSFENLMSIDIKLKTIHPFSSLKLYEYNKDQTDKMLL